MRYSVMVLLVVSTVLATAFGDMRGKAFTPKELAEQSTLVFEGKVLEIETVENYERTFPVKAQIANVLKGDLKEKEFSFKHKSPGKYVIFKEEFNEPAVGQEGTFYLQDHGGTLVLIGYIRKAALEKQTMPDALADAYKSFVKAMRTGETDVINKFCLPHCVSYTYEKRKDPEYGQDINVPFAKDGFADKVVSVRKDGEGCYLVRTGSTAMWFVETKAMGWRLYKYSDKPIQ